MRFARVPRRSLLTAFFVIAVINFLLFIVIFASGERHFVTPARSFGDLTSEFHPDIKSYFSKQLAETNIPALEGKAQILELMKWVMNKIPDDTPHVSNNAIEIFEGGHAICGGMTLVLSAAAQSLGYRSREIELMASPGNLLDTHVVAEIYLDDQWQVFDPTFNVTYIDESGDGLSAEEIQYRLLRNGGGTVEPMFHGDVNYPVRHENYYLRWPTVFGTVTMRPLSELHTRFGSFNVILRNLPLSGYFFAPNRIYLTPDGKIARYMKVHNFVYVLTFLVLPVLLLIIFVVLVIGALRQISRRE